MKGTVIFFYLSMALIPHLLQANCSSNMNQVIVSIVPDAYPLSISWSLRDAETGTLLDTGQANGDTLCVDTGRCVKFTIFDYYGDGICCLYGHGSYTVTLDGAVVATGGQFGYSETSFFNCPAGVNCSNPFTAVLDTMTAPGPETWYSFVPDSTGLYEISTCGLGNTCYPVIYVYDHCMHLLVDTSAEGTSFYNEGGCNGNQAFISAAFPAGQTFFIRIGQQDTSCSGRNIKWQINFAGPIKGCTDSTSCNYNPLATITDTSCLYPPNPLCPLPDLTVDEGIFRASLYLDSDRVLNTDCYVPDGCLSAYGNRLLIRFTTVIKNIGNMDYYLGLPDSSNPEFVYDLCHQHWHYIGYAEYLLMAQNGQQVQIGFKDGFCVEDLQCDSGVIGKFGCINMGISSGCEDAYAGYLDCQWLDITDVDTGNYTMLIGVNWRHQPDALGHYERTYSNNWAQACIHIYYDALGNKNFDTLPVCPRYVDCAGDTFGNAQKDCNGVCNGPTLRGDLNSNGVHDSTDLLLYLSGMTAETLTATSCNDLNADGRITVGDAARLNGCLRYQDGTITNYVNAQTGQHLCEFPYRLTNFLDTVTFSIAGINWAAHYFDISIMNPDCDIMGYELKLRGVIIDSVTSLITGNYKPGIWYSASGHVTELSDEDSALAPQLTQVSFIRVYFNTILDSNICIDKVIDIVNSDIEQVAYIVVDSCLQQLTSVVVTDNDDLILKIVPNPTSGKIIVKDANYPIESVSLLNQLGQELATNYNPEKGNVIIDATRYPAGMYYLRIKIKREVKTFKVVKY